MFSKSEPPVSPKAAPTAVPAVDTERHYDVYCNPHGQPIIVYRDVRFKGMRTLFGQGDHFDRVSQFIELEHPDGRSVCVSRISVVAFCETGMVLGCEPITPK